MSNIPKLRFPEFTDAWEKCKLGSIAKRVKGNDGDMSLPTLTISAGSGWLSQKERFSGNIAGTEQKNYTLLKKGQLSYNHGNSKVAKYGAVFVLKTYEKALVPRVYHSFEMNKNGCADFIEVLFATKLPDRELVKKITSGARTDGLLNISFEGFMDINIKIPTLPEQQKIGNLFKQLDRLITLHKRKWDDVILLKKALLQKMFPKNGSDFPEIRFPEFTDAWEKCKLGKIVKERNEQYPKSNEYPLMAFISGQGIADKGERYNRDFLVSDEESKKYKRTELDDFIYSSNNLETGSIGLNRYGKACISPVYSIFYIDKSNDPYFIGQRLIQKDFIYQMTRYRQGVVYGQWRIHEKDFLKLSIIRPALPEQQKIGNLFKQLDRLITLHKRQHEHYQLLKKALLQQMFV
ncbi:restriction endonuclease subunit S [Avibacterium avium]|uniref:restriction endonuclease subunit S n=1 Tax=Avibacterium avium TaxID=751 RepID=UPI003BF81416